MTISGVTSVFSPTSSGNTAGTYNEFHLARGGGELCEFLMPCPFDLVA